MFSTIYLMATVVKLFSVLPDWSAVTGVTCNDVMATTTNGTLTRTEMYVQAKVRLHCYHLPAHI